MKFIQIAAIRFENPDKQGFYALDENGQIWRHVEAHGNSHSGHYNPSWSKITSPEPNE